VQKKIQQDKLHKLQQTPMFHQMLKDYGGELPADVDPEFFFIEQACAYHYLTEYFHCIIA